jgi:hypothetical protein
VIWFDSLATTKRPLLVACGQCSPDLHRLDVAIFVTRGDLPAFPDGKRPARSDAGIVPGVVIVIECASGKRMRRLKTPGGNIAPYLRLTSSSRIWQRTTLRRAAMDLSNDYSRPNLNAEKERLVRLIVSFEELQRFAGPAISHAPNSGNRRGGKFMGLEERREVSEGMNKYWATRLKPEPTTPPASPPPEPSPSFLPELDGTATARASPGNQPDLEVRMHVVLPQTSDHVSSTFSVRLREPAIHQWVRRFRFRGDRSVPGT